MRNCDNCNFGSYGLDCNSGIETLYCSENGYEHDVQPTDVCDKHQFIEGEYGNEEYLKKEIMGQSRHQFIYGYENKKRTSFFHELDREFPIHFDCNYPMAVYLSEYGLPKMHNEEVDKDQIDIISREYLAFSIAYSILVKSKANVDVDLLNSRIMELISFLNESSLNQGYQKIYNLDELITVMEQSKKFYREYYIDYMENGRQNKSINDIALPFLQLESFISKYKKALNNESYFGIIIDKKYEISVPSIKRINSLVASRINKDISVKVVVEPGKWDSYVGDDGQFVESVHDYETIELDESHKEYVKRIKNSSLI